MPSNKPTNLLRAIVNLRNAGFPNLQSIHKSGNRINSAGEAVEYYIKDMFANTFNIDNADEKENIYREYFSWLGNQNNPPDFILSGSDAVEVKKTIGLPNGIALNSSPPKDYLYKDDPRIVSACKSCEDDLGSWEKKDLIYMIAATEEDRIISLWIVYGNCYAADREIYSRVANGLVKGIAGIKDIEFGTTNELARVNKVDPMGIIKMVYN